MTQFDYGFLARRPVADRPTIPSVRAIAEAAKFNGRPLSRYRARRLRSAIIPLLDRYSWNAIYQAEAPTASEVATSLRALSDEKPRRGPQAKRKPQADEVARLLVSDLVGTSLRDLDETGSTVQAAAGKIARTMKGRRGRDRDDAMGGLIFDLADAYERWAGRRPTITRGVDEAGGGFLALVRLVIDSASGGRAGLSANTLAVRIERTLKRRQALSS